MAKSLRSKREKRLRTLRREIAEPFYDKKEAAKLAAQAAALSAPKLPVWVRSGERMVVESAPSQEEPSAPAAPSSPRMDVEMEDDGGSGGLCYETAEFLKPIREVKKKGWAERRKKMGQKVQIGKRKKRKGKKPHSHRQKDF